MAILQWIVAHIVDIIFFVAVAAVLIFAYVKGEKKIVYRILYALVTEAEAIYGGGTGELKLSAVLDGVYGKLPALVRAVISEARLVKWIEDVLADAKAKWAENADVGRWIAEFSGDGGEDGYDPDEDYLAFEEFEDTWYDDDDIPPRTSDSNLSDGEPETQEDTEVD